MADSTKRKRNDFQRLQALKLRVMARFDEVEFKEEYLPEMKVGTKTMYTEGLCATDDNGEVTITVNPMPHVVDTVIHEILHAVYPEKSEQAIRQLTRRLMRTLTEAELQTIYSEYRLRVDAAE